MSDDFYARYDDDETDDDDQPGLPWPPAGQPPYPDPGRGRRTRVVLPWVIAVIAGAAGFGVVAAALHDLSAAPAASGSTPSASAPALLPSEGSGAGGGSFAIPSTGPGQELRMEIGSKVTAVSATSITLGSGTRQVTAAVTSATKVTGKVGDISGVKVGDLVFAEITEADGKLTATTIQDPASIP